MSEICYVPKTFRGASIQTIARARHICEEYRAEGYDLTLRQLYYQFVSRGWIPNRDTEYKKLGTVVSDARLAGYLDWNYIVDRTRTPRGNSHWDTPAEVIEAAARSYARDKWESQGTRVEVWIEKDALVGVLDSCCPELDVDFFSCRGYTSQSAMWRAAQRIGTYLDAGQDVVILHLGDHDPSGIDMTRDIRERLSLFIAQDRFGASPSEDMEQFMWDCSDRLTVDRIALNIGQVQQYNPPPNPAKWSDTRAASYVSLYGPVSWELDALEPRVLAGLVRGAVADLRDEEVWEAAVDRESSERETLTACSGRWGEVVDFLADSSE